MISFYHDVTKNQTNPSTPTPYTLVHASILSISFKLRSRMTFSETEWRPPPLFSSKHITARHYAAHMQQRRVTCPASWLRLIAPTLFLDLISNKSTFISQKFETGSFFFVLLTDDIQPTNKQCLVSKFKEEEVLLNISVSLSN